IRPARRCFLGIVRVPAHAADLGVSLATIVVPLSGVMAIVSGLSVSATPGEVLAPFSPFRENAPAARKSVRTIRCLNGKSTVAIAIWRFALLMIGRLYRSMRASKARMACIALGDSHPSENALAKTCASLKAVVAPCAPNGGMV